MTEFLMRILRWPALFVVVWSGLALIYRYGPSRTAPRWEWLMPGTLFATVAWLAGSALFSGTCRTSPITTRPTARWARPSA